MITIFVCTRNNSNKSVNCPRADRNIALHYKQYGPYSCRNLDLNYCEILRFTEHNSGSIIIIYNENTIIYKCLSLSHIVVRLNETLEFKSLF